MSEWWYCGNCKTVCQTSQVKKVWLPVAFNPNDKEEYWLCPRCGYDYLEEAEECKICGDIFPKDKMIDGVCDNCIDEMIAKCKQQRSN